MQAQKPDGTLAEEVPAQETEEKPTISLEALLDEPALPQEERRPSFPDPAATVTRTAKLVHVVGRKATVVFRGDSTQFDATIAPEVDPELVSDACAQGEHVLVEWTRGAEPLVVGVLQTRRPRELHLKAESVHIEGEKEVVFKSGRGALRIREDGDIELVGSRISAASRGLFRIVGRLLRLN